MLKLYPIRLREDQITRLEQTYPNRQIAPAIRKMIDTYLDISEIKKKDELIKEKMEYCEIVRYLNQQIEVIEIKELEREQDIIIKSDRQQYLSENPSYLIQHREGKISSIGYNKLQKDMKFSSKQKLVQWLEAQS